jgi:AP-3 complex subunit mu
MPAYLRCHTNAASESVLDHVYRGRPASSRTLLPLYLARPAPRPTVIYLPEVNPPTTLFSILHANLIIFVPASQETEPLFVLEFLHRLIDVLEEFLGAPLIASKIETNYDVVAQILSETCDAGNVCNTESNALRDVVNTPGFIDNLLGGLGLPG